MPPYKKIVVGARLVKAGKARKCYHSRAHKLAKGELLLEVRDGMSWKGYCIKCAEVMVAKGLEKLESLREGMKSRA